MADRESTFVIQFDGKAGDLTNVLNALKSRVRADVNELQSIAGKVELFKGLQDSAKAASSAFFDAKKRVDDLRKAIDAIEGSGGTVGKDLARQMREAERALVDTRKALDKQSDALKAARSGLTAAGVDVSKLAEEEKRLAQAIEAANAAAKAQANRDLLGFKSLRDVQPEVAKVRAAFDALRESGRLSFGELSVASARAKQRIDELESSATGVGESFRNLRVQAVAIVAAMTGLVAAASASARAWRDFSQQVAAVQSISGATQRQIDGLADGVRRLARVMGVDAVESTKALYNIIGSGIEDPVNALRVLESATRAAVAGLTTVDTAAQVGVGVLNAYGLQVGEIDRVFDVLFATVKDGVVSFPDLAQNIGEVIPTARSAKVTLEELGAAFVVMTRNGINASESSTAIRSAIQAIAAPTADAEVRFRALGIELGNFTSVIEQLSRKDLNLSQIRQLVPDARAAKAVQSLAQNFRLLRDEIGEMTKAAGATQAAYAVLANTPQARVDRFNAAIKDLALSFGEFVTNSTGIIQSLTGLLNSFNGLDASTRRVALEVGAFVAAIAGLAVAIRALSVPLNLFVGAVFQSVPALASMTAGLDAASIAMRSLGVAAAAFIGFEFGKWARENVPYVSTFGDALGLVAGALTQAAGLGFDAFNAALSGNARGFIQARNAGQAYLDTLRDEFRAIMSGARERLRDLTNEQARLSEEFGKATAAASAAASGVSGAIGAIATNTRNLITGVEQQIAVLEQRLSAVVAKLGESVAATQANAQSAIGNVAAQVSAQLAALETLRLGEAQSVEQTTAIQRAAAAERLAILKDYSAQAVAAFEAEARARLEVARRNGEDVKRLETELTTARRGVLQGVLDAYRQHFAQLLTLEAGHVANVKAIEDQRRAINLGIEDRIREARRATLTEYEKYADRVRQVDELLSKARQALARGDQKLAEDYAQKALGLTDQIANKVEDSGRVIVDAYEASQKAVSRYEQAQSILNKSLDARKRAEQEGADAARDAADQVRATIDDLTKRVDDLSAKASEGVKLRIETDTAEFDATLAKLEAATAERERLIKISADVTEAQVEIDRLRDELAKGVTLNVDARTDKVEAALQRIEEADPTITANVEPALESLEKVRASAKSLERVRMNVESNAKQVQAEIDLLKRPTESVHTIRIRRVEENATGGVVGEGLRGAAGRSTSFAQAFADGGAVFRRPLWRKVPGAGSGDTVPASLEAGSFVVRKAASRYYGDGVMRALAGGAAPARGYAIGGVVERILRGFARGPLAGGGVSRTAIGDNGGGDSLSSVVSDAYRVIQPLIDAAKTLPQSRTGQNLDDYLAAVLDLIVNSRSLDEARTLLERIRADAANLFGSIMQAQRMRVPIVMGAQTAGDELTKGAPFAEGGPSGTDTVPAWLTPGEWVVKRDAVRKYGAGLLHAINTMRIPRASLAGMFEAPRVQRFAEGGPVGVAPAAARASVGGSGNAYTVNVNAPAGSLFSEENVRRYIVPVFEKLERRTR
jgi:TP901 family phage tail tape measure protein